MKEEKKRQKYIRKHDLEPKTENTKARRIEYFYIQIFCKINHNIQHYQWRKNIFKYQS